MRLFRTTFGTATAGSLLLATFVILSPNARAEQTLSDCDIDGKTPSYVVSGLGQSKLGVTLANGPTPVVIPAGQYQAVGSSFDELHPGEADQTREQWFATFYDAGGASVGAVSVSPDLSAESQTESFPLFQGFDFDDPEASPTAPFTLTGPATSVVFQHAFLESITSETVFATCIGLTPMVVPPGSTSSTSTSTSTTTTSTTTTTTTTTPESTASTSTTSTSTTTIPEGTAITSTSTTSTVAATTPPTFPVLLPAPPTDPPSTPSSLSSTVSTIPPTSRLTAAFNAVAATTNPPIATLVTLPLEVAGVQVSAEEVAYTGSSSSALLEASIVLLGIGLLLLVIGRHSRRAS